MSVATVAPWVPPRAQPEILQVDPAFVEEYMARFVNRRAYTRQSHSPNESGKHYYYQPTVKVNGTKVKLSLDDAAVRRHLAGLQTIGLYATNPETQRSKWIVVDADYQNAHRDLAKLNLELRNDGIESYREMSRRGAHLWIFGDEPLPAKDCLIYMYNVAVRLEIPIRGKLKQAEGIEIFPRQEELKPGQFGNAIRGPFGIHRATIRRYWFEGAAPNLSAQFAFLRQVKGLAAAKLQSLTEGMSIPEELQPPLKIELPQYFDRGQGFRILDKVSIIGAPVRSGNWVLQCPSCASHGGDKSRDNLAIRVADPLYYQCFAGCTSWMIKEALGVPIRSASNRHFSGGKHG